MLRPEGKAAIWGLVGGIVLASLVFGITFKYLPSPREVFGDIGAECRKSDVTRNTDSKDNKSNADNAVPTLKPSNPAPNEGDSAEKKQIYDCEIAAYTRSLSNFTKLLFLATFILALAAGAQFEITRRTARRQLRAYIHIASAQVFNLDKPIERYVFLEFINYGQTPAVETVIWGGEHVREWPLKTELPGDEMGLRKSISPMPPTRKDNVQVPVSNLSAWEEAQLRSGKAGVYAWGVIAYKDIFGARHETHFRLVCEGDGLKNGNMHHTEDGNSAT